MSDLDPLFCNNLMLGRIVSVIGEPVRMDKITTTCERLFFSRILVVVTAEETHLRRLEITNHDGETVSQSIVFEWLPWSYGVCRKLGHVRIKCPRQPEGNRISGEKTWQVKRNDSHKVDNKEEKQCMIRPKMYLIRPML